MDVPIGCLRGCYITERFERKNAGRKKCWQQKKLVKRTQSNILPVLIFFVIFSCKRHVSVEESSTQTLNQTPSSFSISASPWKEHPLLISSSSTQKTIDQLKVNCIHGMLERGHKINANIQLFQYVKMALSGCGLGAYYDPIKLESFIAKYQSPSEGMSGNPTVALNTNAAGPNDSFALTSSSAQSDEKRIPLKKLFENYIILLNLSKLCSMHEKQHHKSMTFATPVNCNDFNLNILAELLNLYIKTIKNLE